MTDIGIHWFTRPPCLIPVSERAKKLLKMGRDSDVDAVIPKDGVEHFIKDFPKDFVYKDVTNSLAVPFKVVIKGA